MGTMTGVVKYKNIIIRSSPSTASSDNIVEKNTPQKTAFTIYDNEYYGSDITWYKIASPARLAGMYTAATNLSVTKPSFTVEAPSEEELSEYSDDLKAELTKVNPNISFPTQAAVLAPVDTETTDRLKNDYWKYVRSMGCPPMYNQKIDLQYIDEICPGAGRVYSSTMLSNPAILSLCPGKVKYLPGFSSDEQSNFKASVLQAAKAVGADFADRLVSSSDLFDGQLYDFQPDPAEYANVLNTLCRTSAMLLDISDQKMINSNNTFGTFDYSFWTFPSKDVYDSKKSNIFTLARKVAQSAVDDSSYMHYFIASGNTTVSEDISTNTEKSVIEDALSGSGIDSMARNLNFLFGGVASTEGIIGDAMTELDQLMTAYNESSFVGKLGKGMSNYLKGGRMVFPQMLGEITYSKPLNVNLHFASPYGDKRSIFLYCLVPIFSLLAMALPKQITDNMYTYPFIVRCYQQGWYNSDLAVISNIGIERGGQDDTAWTVDGLATEWDVRLTIQPLYSSLMTTSAANPLLFMNNGALVEYLGNLCGVDLKANNLQKKADIAMNMIYNKFTDFPTRMVQGITTRLSSKIENLFQWHS